MGEEAMLTVPADESSSVYKYRSRQTYGVVSPCANLNKEVYEVQLFTMFLFVLVHGRISIQANINNNKYCLPGCSLLQPDKSISESLWFVKLNYRQ